MSQAAVASPSSLLISRTYPASVERVFKAWTDANQLGQWFAPTDDYTTKASVDLQVGHEYRIAITHKGGNVHTILGTYRLIDPPRKLVYTWRWEGGPMADTSSLSTSLPRARPLRSPSPTSSSPTPRTATSTTKAGTAASTACSALSRRPLKQPHGNPAPDY